MQWSLSSDFTIPRKVGKLKNEVLGLCPFLKADPSVNTLKKYVQAESLLVRALEIREQQLGPNHAYTAESLNNLAALY